MSKGLERLKELTIKLCENCPYNKPNMDGDVCSKCEETLSDIKKELKALEIIKNKYVNILGFKILARELEKPNAYNLTYASYEEYFLTQEEYDLLKEALL